MEFDTKSSLSTMYESYPAISPAKYAGKLKGKVVLVTGCSVGIGRSIAKAFAAAGASVAAVARREPDLLTLMDEISAEHGTAIPIVADITAKHAARDICSRVERELGAVDILINNAAIVRIGPLAGEDEDLDIWWRVHETNVKAPVSLIRAVLPSMLSRNTGILMMTSSRAATLPLPVMSAYTSSKAAITKFHESLARELDDTNILSFAVNPGMVKTQLGSPEDAINKAEFEHPVMQKLFASVEGDDKTHDPEVCADVMVALAADQRYKVLNGCYVDAAKDLVPVVEEAEKEGKGRIGSERLYLVNIGNL